MPSFAFKDAYFYWLFLITRVLIACLGIVLTHTTFMIRTKLAKLYISPIRLHSASSVRIRSSVNNFQNMLPTVRLSPLGHLLSGSFLNHLMRSKNAECILMSLSAMPRGVSVAHINILILPLHHL